MGGEETGLGAELIHIFLEDMPTKLVSIRQSLAEQDAHTLTRIAHTLKSSSAQLGALPFSALCKQLEQQARAENLTESAATLAALEAAYAGVREALQEKLGE
jgi:HPt (histidine-containing phosphotransfer) domain-containing protein